MMSKLSYESLYSNWDKVMIINFIITGIIILIIYDCDWNVKIILLISTIYCSTLDKIMEPDWSLTMKQPILDSM